MEVVMSQLDIDSIEARANELRLKLVHEQIENGLLRRKLAAVEKLQADWYEERIDEPLFHALLAQVLVGDEDCNDAKCYLPGAHDRGEFGCINDGPGPAMGLTTGTPCPVPAATERCEHGESAPHDVTQPRFPVVLGRATSDETWTWTCPGAPSGLQRATEQQQ